MCSVHEEQLFRIKIFYIFRFYNQPVTVISQTANDARVNTRTNPVIRRRYNRNPRNEADNVSASSELSSLRNQIQRLETKLNEVIASRVPTIDLTIEEKVKVEIIGSFSNNENRCTSSENWINDPGAGPSNQFATNSNQFTESLITFSPSAPTGPATESNTNVTRESAEPLIVLSPSAPTELAAESAEYVNHESINPFIQFSPSVPSEPFTDSNRHDDSNELLDAFSSSVAQEPIIVNPSANESIAASTSNFFLNDGQFLQRYQHILRVAAMQGNYNFFPSN